MQAFATQLIISDYRSSIRTRFIFCPNIFSQFLQRISIACYAERCISYDRFRLPPVCHSPVSCQNDSSYDHAVFPAG